MLVIPHIIDQFIWDGKVAQLGASPHPKQILEDRVTCD
jgi:hypothetical protein